MRVTVRGHTGSVGKVRSALVAGAVGATIVSVVGVSSLRQDDVGQTGGQPGAAEAVGVGQGGQPFDAASAATEPRVTMATLRRWAAAQRFRPYTGSRAPAISQRAAVKLADLPGDPYSLGLWDAGMMHRSEEADLATAAESVRWHSVWVVALVWFSEDRNESHPSGGSAVSYSKPPPDPGSVRSVTMIDANTGEFFLAMSF